MTNPAELETLEPAPILPVHTGYRGTLRSCPAELADGWLVHAAALQRGQSTLLFPGQALMAYTGEDPAHGASFAHGVPNTTWLSTATLVQDKRMTRDLLESVGVRVPRGRSFSIRRGAPYAKAFADELGYPVTLRPMIGESTIEVFEGIADEEELSQAIRYYGRVPTERPQFTTSSYAFTQILTPKTSTSTRARGTYRYLVEESPEGDYVRLLTVDGELVSAVHLPEGPWSATAQAREITGEIHGDIVSFLETCQQAIPGLAVSAIDIKIPDVTAAFDSDNSPVVVAVSERPWLHVHHRVNPTAMAELADRVLGAGTSESPSQAASPWAGVTIDFALDGLSQVDRDCGVLETAAASSGLHIELGHRDAVAGKVHGSLTGGVGEVALFLELTVSGDLLPEPAMAVEARPASPAA